jgi:hypothetical protein
MGFWPFGRDPANVEIVSRVITAATQNGYRVRGKLTIHFYEPQRQADADLAGDRVSALAVALLREAPDHGRVIGAENQLSAELTARYPGDIARARGVELAALHVVGDPALSDELRRAHAPSAPPSAPASVPPPPLSAAPITSRPPAPSRPPQPTSAPPPRAPFPSAAPLSTQGTPTPGPVRRRASSQIRAIQSLLMPPGTPPAAMGQFIAPLVKDSAARLLIGFLRAHDLVSVRRVAIDENSAEMLASLVPVSDAPPGGYEASRSGEIARWQTTLGQGPMFSLQHEVRAKSLHLAKDALARAEVMAALADAVLEAVAAGAFPEEAGLLAEVARFPSSLPDDFVTTLAQDLSRIAGAGDDPGAVAAALAPLIATVKEDLNVAALIIKQSSGA